MLMWSFAEQRTKQRKLPKEVTTMNNWIAGAVHNKGGLHRILNVPQGQTIPVKKIDTTAHSNNSRLARMANLVKTLRGLNK